MSRDSPRQWQAQGRTGKTMTKPSANTQPNADRHERRRFLRIGAGALAGLGLVRLAQSASLALSACLLAIAHPAMAQAPDWATARRRSCIAASALAGASPCRGRKRPLARQARSCGRPQINAHLRIALLDRFNIVFPCLLRN